MSANVEWIKLQVDIFSNKKVRIINAMPGGPGMVLTWIKLLCLAGAVNKGGQLEIADGYPYDEKMLAVELEQTVEEVEKALQVFKNLGMITKNQKVYAIKNWPKYQNEESLDRIREAHRDRAKAYRERKKQGEDEPRHVTNNVTDNVTRNVTITLPSRDDNVTVTGENKNRELEKREGEKELTPQTPLDGGPECVRAPYGDLDSEFRTLWEMYPTSRREGKKQALQSYREARAEIGYETIRAALVRYLESVRGMEARYIKLASTWFRDCIEDEVFEDEDDETVYAGPDADREPPQRPMTDEERRKADEALIGRFFKKTDDGWHMIGLETQAANTANK